MVKIKTKKELTLPELLEWAWKNYVEFEHFYGSRKTTVYFGSDSTITMNGYVQPDETFAVEVEKKITEDSVIPKLVVVYDDGHVMHTKSYRDTSIDTALCGETVETGEHIAFYMLNGDMTMTLIWKDGRMVE